VTDVQQGVVVVRNPGALGLPTGNTIVEAGAALNLESDLDLEPITIFGDGVQPPSNGHNSGALRNTNGFNTYTGTLTLGSNATVGVDLGSQLTINATGTITDGASSFNLTKEGAGTLVLGSANSYEGTTTVNQGVLAISDSNALGTGDGTAATGTLIRDGSQLQVSGGINVANERLALS